MKPGTRAIGVATSGSEGGARSTVAAAVVRADRVVDGLRFGSIAVGGTDATVRIAALIDRLARPDARYLLVAGIAPAWFNLLDLPRLADRTDRPTVSVSFEASDGLVGPFRAAFSGDALATRLATYERQPSRHPVTLGDDRVFVRAAGCSVDTATRVVRAFTPTGGRPEPLRVARLAARAGHDAIASPIAADDDVDVNGD